MKHLYNTRKYLVQMVIHIGYHQANVNSATEFLDRVSKRSAG